MKVTAKNIHNVQVEIQAGRHTFVADEPRDVGDDAGLAQENRGTKVTANIIRVQTIDVKHQRDLEPSPKNISWTTPEEIAAAVQYLIADEAGLVNGVRMPPYGSP